MSQRAKAVICRERNQPVVVEEIEIDPPQQGEVMIKMVACGICHSDASAVNGTLMAFPLPLVMGHEGAGTVIAVGPGVHNLQVGDHVLSSFASMCGKCRYCTTGKPALCNQSNKTVGTLPDGSLRTRDMQGNPVNISCGLGVMAEYAVAHVDNLVKIDPSMPLDKAALISCGVMTGVGAATNTAKVQPGSIAVVFGCGGVGLNTIQGCNIAGARTIIAVDTSDFKLALAKQFGATHTINASNEENVVKTIRRMTGDGADYAFECIGLNKTVEQAYGVLAKGGIAVVVGVAPASDMTTIRTCTLPFEEKTLTGSYYGSARPQLDFPRLIGLYQVGKLKLDELITRTYTIDEAPLAFADLMEGKNARGVIIF
jgi:NDMA-dependent alcohol dehydrogenase